MNENEIRALLDAAAALERNGYPMLGDQLQRVAERERAPRFYQPVGQVA